MYTAIVLSDKSQKDAKRILSWDMGNGGDILAHHVTVNMGRVTEGPAADIELGRPFVMTATHYGIFENKVIALKVQGIVDKIPTTNKVPHITMVVYRDNGGKPVMSNNITEWILLDEPIRLMGNLQEC